MEVVTTHLCLYSLPPVCVVIYSKSYLSCFFLRNISGRVFKLRQTATLRVTHTLKNTFTFPSAHVMKHTVARRVSSTFFCCVEHLSLYRVVWREKQWAYLVFIAGVWMWQSSSCLEDPEEERKLFSSHLANRKPSSAYRPGISFPSH